MQRLKKRFVALFEQRPKESHGVNERAAKVRRGGEKEDVMSSSVKNREKECEKREERTKMECEKTRGNRIQKAAGKKRVGELSLHSQRCPSMAAIWYNKQGRILAIRCD